MRGELDRALGVARGEGRRGGGKECGTEGENKAAHPSSRKNYASSQRKYPQPTDPSRPKYSNPDNFPHVVALHKPFQISKSPPLQPTQKKYKSQQEGRREGGNGHPRTLHIPRTLRIARTRLKRPALRAIVRVHQPADGPVARLQRRERAAALRVRLADLCAGVRCWRSRCGRGGC